jgi:hypothetical protein
MPMNVCEASLKREKSSRPSNLVAVGINVGEASAVIVGWRVGDASIVGAGVAVGEIGVGAACGAQAVSIKITMNSKFPFFILFSFCFVFPLYYPVLCLILLFVPKLTNLPSSAWFCIQ